MGSNSPPFTNEGAVGEADGAAGDNLYGESPESAEEVGEEEVGALRHLRARVFTFLVLPSVLLLTHRPSRISGHCLSGHGI